jgi:hypothetical protein
VRLGVAGGRQGRDAGVADRDHRPLYDLAVFGALDAGGWTTVRSFATPDAPVGVGHRFGAPGRDGDRVWLCTEREVLAWPQGPSWSRPSFADLHHVARTPDGLLAVATGAGGVVDVETGRFWPVRPGVRPPVDDLRWRETHDPQHPNHVFAWRGRTWVTRGGGGDVVPLAGGPAVSVADVVVHDGVPVDDGVWFTAVDGRLLRIDLDDGRVLATVRLGGGEAPLGWCRGLAVDGDLAHVGFTRLRATRWRRNLAWVRGRLRGGTTVGDRPTRVVTVELRTGRVLREVDTEPFGVDAIFGLCALP